jgi:hypothetical protein
MKAAIQEYFGNRFEIFYQKYLPETKTAGRHEIKATCPFHKGGNEKHPSLYINMETGQYFCQACGKKGDIFHFYAKVNGLLTKRDFGKVLRGIADDFGIPRTEQKARVVKTYDYADPSGALLFQVCRMEPKDFRQRRPDGNGQWIWNLKGIDPVLYRLPDVMNAQEIIVVEGEKDCDCLANMGFTATTCPMGAKKWKPQYNACLQGKNVVLIPDNDNEGREHMLQVAVSLDGTTSSLKLLDLPGLPSKGDVSDWVGNFQEPDEASERLAVMIDNAPPYEPEKPKTIEDAVIEAGEFACLEIGTKSSFVEPWLTEQSIGLISGWRGTGKTWLALSLLDAVTTGESFGPWRVETSVPCLFLDGEMPVGDIQERLNSLDPDPHRICPLYVYSDCYANQLGLPRAHLAYDNWRQTIKRVLTTRGVKLWVIDNLASLASGLDESSKRDFDPINQFLLELRFQGISTIMLHHMNKEGGQRGTSAREDNIDFSISLKTPTDYTPEDGCRFILHFTKSRVRTKDLSLVADVEFRLTEDEIGRAFWLYGNVKQQRKREVLRLFDQGMDAKAICETVDLSKGYVSKIRKKAIEDGLITSKGNLTPDGFLFVNNV